MGKKDWEKKQTPTPRRREEDKKNGRGLFEESYHATHSEHGSGKLQKKEEETR